MASWTLHFDNRLFDAFLRRRPAASARAVRAAPSGSSRKVSERRAQAMRGFFPKLSAWLARRSYLAEMRAVDRYLAQASDLVDLERRIREIERGGSTFRLY